MRQPEQISKDWAAENSALIASREEDQPAQQPTTNEPSEANRTDGHKKLHETPSLTELIVAQILDDGKKEDNLKKSQESLESQAPETNRGTVYDGGYETMRTERGVESGTVELANMKTMDIEDIAAQLQIA